MRVIVVIIPTNLYFFRKTQKQESIFQQVSGLVTKKYSCFLYNESRSTSKAYRIL